MPQFIPSDDNATSAFAPPALGPGPAPAVALKTWTREILRLDEDAIVTVMELACTDPGCPLIETVIAVFDATGSRKWKLHQALAAVTRLDLHFALTATPSSPRGLVGPAQQNRPEEK